MSPPPVPGVPLLSANPASPRAGRRAALAVFQSGICVNIPTPEACLGKEDVENLPSSSCQAGYVKKMLITNKKFREAAAGAGVEDGGLWSLPPFLLMWVEVRGGGFSDAGVRGGGSIGIFTPDGFKIKSIVKKPELCLH